MCTETVEVVITSWCKLEYYIKHLLLQRILEVSLYLRAAIVLTCSFQCSLPWWWFIIKMNGSCFPLMPLDKLVQPLSIIAFVYYYFAFLSSFFSFLQVPFLCLLTLNLWALRLYGLTTEPLFFVTPVRQWLMDFGRGRMKHYRTACKKVETTAYMVAPLPSEREENKHATMEKVVLCCEQDTSFLLFRSPFIRCMSFLHLHHKLFNCLHE